MCSDPSANFRSAYPSRELKLNHFEPVGHRDKIGRVGSQVALVRVTLPSEAAETRIGGLAFRFSKWADGATIMGYPPVPQTTQAHQTVQTGEVVNPDVETPPVRLKAQSLALLDPNDEGSPAVRWFLVSAVRDRAIAAARSSEPAAVSWGW